MGKWLMFPELELDRPRKTKLIIVCRRDTSEHLGHIEWHNGWREYVFRSDEDVHWSSSCLTEVRDKLVELMAERRK